MNSAGSVQDMLSVAANSPFDTRLAQQQQQLRIFLEPERIGVTRKQSFQIVVLRASGILERPAVGRQKRCHCT